MEPIDQPSLTVEPIGYVRSGSPVKFSAPSQPILESQEVNRIELLPGKQFELALQDLEGFDKIWLVSWFDRNKHWRPRVMPPRGEAKRRGVFATRSPHRPNPIGLTCVSLLKVEGLILHVGPIDLIDGTPILDIKPYLRTVDSYPESTLGWVEAIEAEEQAAPVYQIEILPDAQTQLDWLKEQWNIDFTERAFKILQRDPTPHRTRRILQIEPNRFRIACGAWRMYFQIHGDRVVVGEIARGYSDETLSKPGREKIVDREALLAFPVWNAERRTLQT